MTFTSSAAGAAGRARMKQIAGENKIEIDRIVAGLLSPENLGRVATVVDQVAAEALATAFIKSRRLRSAGKDDSAERHQIALLIKHFTHLGADPRPSPATEQPSGDIVAVKHQ